MESESKNNIILDKPVAMRNSEKSADPVRRRSIRTNIRHPRPIFHARITALAPVLHDHHSTIVKFQTDAPHTFINRLTVICKRLA